MKKNAKKLKKKLSRAHAKPVPKHRAPAPKRKVVALRADLAAAKAVIPAPSPSHNGGSAPKKRRGPTSIRFDANDLELLNRLKERWRTDGPTTTLRKAMQLADTAVVCTFVRET